MIRTSLGMFIASVTLVAQPLAAADFPLRNTVAADSQPAAFGGLTIKLPFGAHEAAKPEARLQLTTYRPNSAEPWRLRSFNSSGIALGVSKPGKPLFYVGGQEVGQAERKMGLSKGTSLVLVGGVLLAVVVVVAAANSAGLGDTCPEVGGSRDHCINP
ncbi:MAG: hypothetical protein ABIW33_05300 [Sphingomicrobium sp.]